VIISIANITRFPSEKKKKKTQLTVKMLRKRGQINAWYVGRFHFGAEEMATTHGIHILGGRHVGFIIWLNP
jgi:hypothetical protein